MRLQVLFAAILLLFSAPLASAEPIKFEGLRFNTPDGMVRFDGGPRPPTPFLRFKRGSEKDPQYDFIEVMSDPEAALEGKITPENFAEFAQKPAGMFCKGHETLRNSTRTIGAAKIIDVGYTCIDHSKHPENSRQVVRVIAVFHDGKFTTFMFARTWRKAPHPDDQKAPEEWMTPTDSLAASIDVCGDGC